MVTAANGESATDSMLSDQQDNTTYSAITTCGVTRLQHCIHPLTAYLTQSPVDELQVLFPVYSRTVLDTVCRFVSDTCYSALLSVMT